MGLVTIYGLICLNKDEKSLMQRVNAYLATHKRTTSKAKDPDRLKAYEPLSIKHFYWNLNKETATWCDIYPNESLNGSYFFPGHRECGWLMHVRIDTDRFPSGSLEKAGKFINHLLLATGLEHVVIKESDDLSAGLERGDFA